MRIPNIGSTSTPSTPEASLPAKPDTAPSPSAVPVSPAVQDSKDKVGGLKMEGQMREAYVKSLFKMPGVEVKGAGLDDPAISAGFKNFDKPLPSVKMDWPEDAKWKETTDKDGTVHRQMTDANGSEWRESVQKDGSRERLMTDKAGNRKMETTDPSGYILRGGSDMKGNSWTIDSKGVVTRAHSDSNNKQYMEVRYPDGERNREMVDIHGNYYKEKLQQDGKLERERGDAAGNKQMEARDSNGVWIRGFSDSKGNSYTVDNSGSSTRMHSDKSGTNYSERVDKDGSRLRIIVDPKGDISTEQKDVHGRISRTSEKFNASQP